MTSLYSVKRSVIFTIFFVLTFTLIGKGQIINTDDKVANEMIIKNEQKETNRLNKKEIDISSVFVSSAEDQPKTIKVDTTFTLDENGLNQTTIVTSAGNVTYYRPTSLFAGSAVSGRVVVEPNGSSPPELAENSRTLGGCVLGNEKTTTPLSEGTYTIHVSDTISNKPDIILYDTNDHMVYKNDFEMEKYDSVNKSNDLHFPDFIMTNEASKFGYPNDGNIQNTQVFFQNVPGTILSEASDGQGYVMTPPNLSSGPTDVTIVDGENVFTGSVNTLDLKIKASKYQLKPGQHTIITITACGFEGLEKPVLLTLANLTPEILAFPDQSILIDPEMIDSMTGCIVKTYVGFGIKPGNWNIEGKLSPPDEKKYCCYVIAGFTGEDFCAGLNDEHKFFCIPCPENGKCPKLKGVNFGRNCIVDFGEQGGCGKLKQNSFVPEESEDWKEVHQ